MFASGIPNRIDVAAQQLIAALNPRSICARIFNKGVMPSDVVVTLFVYYLLHHAQSAIYRKATAHEKQRAIANGRYRTLEIVLCSVMGVVFRFG